jgi:hypothetical protein
VVGKTDLGMTETYFAQETGKLLWGFGLAAALWIGPGGCPVTGLPERTVGMRVDPMSLL